MNQIINLYLLDFESFVRNKFFDSSDNVHPVFYYENPESICFYKPVGSIIYKLELQKDDESLKLLPEEFTINGLKQEFKAVEIPIKPDEPMSITGTIM